MPRRLVAVVGPTASGKSATALALALRFNGEVVNGDSRQIYRGMEIGTAAPTQEERSAVPHHLYGHVDPRTVYSLDASGIAARTEEALKQASDPSVSPETVASA